MEPRGMEPRGMEARGMEPRGMEPRGMEARGMEPRAMEPRGPGPNPRGPMPGGIQGPGPLNMGANVPQGPRQVLILWIMINAWCQAPIDAGSLIANTRSANQ